MCCHSSSSSNSSSSSRSGGVALDVDAGGLHAATSSAVVVVPALPSWRSAAEVAAVMAGMAFVV